MEGIMIKKIIQLLSEREAVLKNSIQNLNF